MIDAATRDSLLVPWHTKALDSTQSKPLITRLLADAASGDANDYAPALTALVMGHERGLLDEDVKHAMVPLILKIYEGSGTTWDPRWGGFVEELAAANQLTTEQWLAYQGKWVPSLLYDRMPGHNGIYFSGLVPPANRPGVLKPESAQAWFLGAYAGRDSAFPPADVWRATERRQSWISDLLERLPAGRHRVRCVLEYGITFSEAQKLLLSQTERELIVCRGRTEVDVESVVVDPDTIAGRHLVKVGVVAKTYSFPQYYLVALTGRGRTHYMGGVVIPEYQGADEVWTEVVMDFDECDYRSVDVVLRAVSEPPPANQVGFPMGASWDRAFRREMKLGRVTLPATLPVP